jgi:hypothetical protein
MQDMIRKKKASFNWEDPFLLDDQLTEDERARGRENSSGDYEWLVLS